MLINIIIVIIGLCLFEIITCVDNAIINANILKTMPPKYRKMFLGWGLLFAVFVVRGILPFIIVWLANPNLSVVQIVTATFSNSSEIKSYLDQSKPLLLLGGGVYLFFVFLSWLFLEEKKYAFLVEGFIHRQGAWFYAVSSVFTTVIVYSALQVKPMLALAATIGVSAFFITDGFKKNAEVQEKQLFSSGMGVLSKIMYLEILDASFSIDGVIGAFAFTMSVPLIIIGNGLGALVVREVTIKGINVVSRYAYLKNGAMYSIGVLGLIMISESFNRHYPFWLAPLNTLLLLIIFFSLSVAENRRVKRKKT